MLARLTSLTRYTGAYFVREAGRVRLPAVFVPPVLASLPPAATFNPSRQFSWSQVHPDWAEERQLLSDTAGQPHERTLKRRPGSTSYIVEHCSQNPPSNRLYVGNLTDNNRHEVVAFVNTLPDIVSANNEFLADGRRRNFMHLTFKSESAAQSAVKELKERFAQTGLRLDFATQLQSPMLYVGDVSPTIRQAVLQTTSQLPGFERFYDYPARDGGLKDFMHVSFSDTLTAGSAHDALTRTFATHGVRVDYALKKPKAPKTEPPVQETMAPSSDLFIGNLPFNATQAEIAAAFDGIPGFLELYMSRDYNGRNRGFARASFDSVYSATEAIDLLSSRSIQDRPIRATYSKARATRPAGGATKTLFIGGLPHDVSKETVQNAFAGCQGLKEVHLTSTPLSGRPSWALADFETVEQAQVAAETCHYKPLYPNGPPMRVDYHHGSKPVAEKKEHPPSSTLFVGGIKSRTVEDLHDLFAAFSPRNARVVVSDSTGHPRGFGYVTFNDVQEAAEAMRALDGKRIEEDTTLRVNYAAPESERRTAYELRMKKEGTPNSYGNVLSHGRGTWGAGDDPNSPSLGSPRRRRSSKNPFNKRIS